MPQPKHVMALPLPKAPKLDKDTAAYFQLCRDKLGFVPNVLAAYTLRPEKLKNFMTTYNTLMLGDSKLSKLEREMVAVVVSSVNRCYYCLVAHGQAVRRLSGDPELGEMLAKNYRVAKLSKRHRAMLDFAWKLTETPARIDEDDRKALFKAGIEGEEYFDLCDVIAFYNASNRMATGLDMMPNPEYHKADR
jgi:uncharacterized peroxidase-related enzyme